jgi:hypothetical protein
MLTSLTYRNLTPASPLVARIFLIASGVGGIVMFLLLRLSK